MKIKPTVVTAPPLPGVPDYIAPWQYRRYQNLLAQEKVSAYTTSGGYTNEQLRLAARAMGKCPPGYENKCRVLSLDYGSDTPFISPAPGISPMASLNNKQVKVSKNRTLNARATNERVWNGTKYITTYGNNSGAGTPEMAVWRSMPSSFAQPKKQTVSPELYGYATDGTNGISENRFISVTHQRVSGGNIVENRRKLTVVPRVPKTLNYIVLQEGDQSKTLKNLSGLNQTTKFYTQPPKVGTTVSVNGQTFQNIQLPGGSGFEGVPPVKGPGDPIGNGGGGGGGGGDGGGGGGGGGGGPNIVDPDAPQFNLLDINGVRFNQKPAIDITPLEIDSQGNYFAGGPKARAYMSSPTPEVSFPANDLFGIAENTELLINGRKVIIRGGGLSDIKTQVNCGSMGVEAFIEKGDSEEQDTITLVSCNGNPFTIANGCGGGTYQQVGDFHINRGFEQQRNKTVNSNAHLISSSLSTYKDEDGSLNKTNFGYFGPGGNAKDLNPEIGKQEYLKFYPVPASTNDISGIGSKANPFFIDTESTTTTFTTSGSGYRVGDRLRLVGGTPVTNSKGPITKVCIENAGSGYKNPANLQILFDSSDNSGIGAVAVVTALDENGGIAEIVMRNGGAGYDFKKPPKVSIYDATPTTTEYTSIDAAWPAQPYGANIEVTANQYVRIDAQTEVLDALGKVVGNEVQSRYLLATGDHAFGEMVEVAKKELFTGTNNVTNIERIEDNKYKNRVKFTLANTTDLVTPGTGKGMRPNSYVMVTHYPVGAITGPLEILGHTGNATVNFEYSVEYNPQLEQTYLNQNSRTTSPITDIQVSRREVALYANVSGNIECVGHSYMYNPNDSSDGGNITLSQIYDTSGNPVLANATNSLADGGNVWICPSTVSKFWIPEHYDDGSVFGDTDTSTPYFVINHPDFSTDAAVSQAFPANTDVKVYNIQPWWNGIRNVSNPPFIDSIDPRTPKNEPVLSAKIGIDGDTGEFLDDSEGGRNYKTFAGPIRAAKFIVTGVDSQGAITSLRVIDRGLYANFPSDLTYGIPLEYDYATDGSVSIPEGKAGTSVGQDIRGNTLGVVDPSRNNIAYGTKEHPEYTRYSNFKSGRGIFVNDSDLVIDGMDDPEEWEGRKDWIVGKVEDNGQGPANSAGLAALLAATQDQWGNKVVIWYMRWLAAGRPKTQYRLQFPVESSYLADLLNRTEESLEDSETVGGITYNPKEILASYRESQAALANRSDLIPYKHGDWASYQEFFYDGKSFQPYTGSPGAYDPSTYVALNPTELRLKGPAKMFAEGKLLRKDRLIELDPKSIEYGLYKGTRTTGEYQLAGGTGARVFLTAQEVPNCSEKGTAKESLNLPDEVVEVNTPRAFTRALNNALTGAGYSPTDIKFKFTDLGDIGQIDLVSTYPGFEIDEPNPGFIEKLGLPKGTYNTAMLCIEATLNDPTLTNDSANAIIDQFYDSEYFGALTGSDLANVTGLPSDLQSLENTAVLSLLCVDKVGPANNPPLYLSPGATGAPYTGMPPAVPLNDNNSIFNGGYKTVITELFKYDLTNIYGDKLRLGSTEPKQTTDVSIFSSKRFNDFNSISLYATPIEDTIVIPEVHNQANAWVDNYNGGWAYLENGKTIRSQSNLTDTKFITNVLAYDRDTGIKNSDLNLWDPFKGVLPGVIQNEIHHINEIDPVAYTNTRSSFGRTKVGQVWWDTSTIRYEWYEQGTNEERHRHWGRTFPGSSVTVCEWVESKALPQNWNGNGSPRWRDRYITERHHDPVTGEYEQYYYYWVQNRTILDDRVKRNWNRQFDVETIAKYISNPVGYGLNVVAFVSPESFNLYNTNQYITDNDTHIQINYSSNLNPDGLKHTAWKLMRENDDASDVPQHLSDKLIDSLASQDAIGQTVPDFTLSYAEKYGIGFRPRQTMFVDIREARRVMANVLNELLADIKLETQYPEWDSDVEHYGYTWSRTNWYEKLRTDNQTNKVIRYDDSYKPVYKTSSVAELYKFKDLPDGTVIQVDNEQNNSSELWIYISNTADFKQISISDETLQFNDAVFTDSTTPLLSAELRSVLIALRDKVFVNTNKWNKLFFAMLKHAYMEQNQLDWAFKTSYLYVEKEEDDLIAVSGFKPDNFQKVLDYMNEVKPYTSKIREYKDGKKTPIEYIGESSLSDFDNPPYVDNISNTVIILDETNPEDLKIMQNSIAHSDYITVTDKSQSPIRTANTKLVFDRTNWLPTMRNWNKETTPVNMSIAENFANIVPLYTSNISLQADAQGYLQVANEIRAVDRILAYSPDAKATFIAEINTYFDDVTAYNNADIITNSTVLYNMIEDGGLDRTLALLKKEVGGNFRGETLDAQKFQTIIDDVNYINQIIKEFGFDSQGFDSMLSINDTTYTDDRNANNYGIVTTIGVGDTSWDSTKELVNYQGVFDTDKQGNVTLRRNEENYEGFDGVTFQRVLYGEERPEEMALIDPLESLVMTVTTSEFALGENVITTQYDPHDVANANVIHSGISLSDIEIVNPGIGYVNPTLRITDSTGYGPTTPASANVIVNSSGSITGFANVVSGSGYNSFRFTLTDDIRLTTFGDKSITENTIELLSNVNARVGQILYYNSNLLGEILDINNNTITLSSPLSLFIPTGSTLSASGKDFYARAVVPTTTQTVLVDKDYVIQSWENVSYTFSSVSGNNDYVSVANVEFRHFNDGTITNIISGSDPDETDAVYYVDTVNGWDTANVDAAQGSFDVQTNDATALVVEKIPYGAEVKHRVHLNLFGSTDYLRIRPETTTHIVGNVYSYSEKITLDNDNFLIDPTTRDPGVIWVGSEQIKYARRSGKTISLLTRGVAGTTIQDHVDGTEVYSGEFTELFNHLNPAANIWLDTGTRYELPASWDEAIDLTPSNPNDNLWNVQVAWDEISNSNITISNVSANVTTVTTANGNVTSAVLELSGNANLAVDEGVRITNGSNAQVVLVDQISGSNVTLVADHRDVMFSNVFVQSATVTLSSFNYAGQEAGDTWDNAVIAGQSAQSLADRANADYTTLNSIMRFLHNL